MQHAAAHVRVDGLRFDAEPVCDLFAATVGWLTVSLPAGAVVDRVSKRSLMIGCDAARVVIVASVPLAAAFHRLSMAHLYLAAVLLGTLSVFFEIACQSYAPVLLARTQLVEGNSRIATTKLASVAPERGRRDGVAAGQRRTGSRSGRLLVRRQRGIAPADAYPRAGTATAARRDAEDGRRDRRGAVVRRTASGAAAGRRLQRDGRTVPCRGSRALAIAVAGSWLAVLCIVCSPLRRLRDIPIEEGYGKRPERSASRVAV